MAAIRQGIIILIEDIIGETRNNLRMLPDGGTNIEAADDLLRESGPVTPLFESRDLSPILSWDTAAYFRRASFPGFIRLYSRCERAQNRGQRIDIA